MKSFILTFFCVSTLLGSEGDWYDRWSRSGNTWFEKWSNSLNGISNLPHDEKIELLGRAIKIGSKKILSSEEEIIFRKSQAALLSVPGHADYFVNEIHQARATATSPEELRGRDGKISWSNYNRVRWDAFDTMKHLPSVETVRALGEFLADDKDPEALGPEDKMECTLGIGSNSGLSILALRSLIHDDPIKSQKPHLEYGENKAWRDWYEQVKAGNRTFSFEGDSTAYDLNGPAPKEKLARIERDQKRDLERAGGVKKTVNTAADKPATDAVEQSTAFIGAVIAFFLCGLAAWTLIRGKRIR